MAVVAIQMLFIDKVLTFSLMLTHNFVCYCINIIVGIEAGQQPLLNLKVKIMLPLETKNFQQGNKDRRVLECLSLSVYKVGYDVCKAYTNFTSSQISFLRIWMNNI